MAVLRNERGDWKGERDERGGPSASCLKRKRYDFVGGVNIYIYMNIYMYILKG